MKPKTISFSLMVLLIPVLSCAGLWQYLMWGTSSPNPAVTMDELGGLTPDQVIARLGTPRFDPRKPDPRNPDYKPWTPELESERGPLYLEYSDAELANNYLHPHFGHVYDIYFQDGHVSKIYSALK